MFTGPTLRRLFRRNTKKRVPASRPLSRWGRCQLNFDRLEDRTVPATIMVTGNQDTVLAGDGTVTLREAIAAINAGNNLGDADIIAQSPGTFGAADSITFSGAMTIQTGGQIAITKAVTIDGLGTSSTILQNVLGQGTTSRIFNVSSTVTMNVKMQDMEIKGGNVSTTNVGGAIFSAGADLELNNVKLTGNTAIGGQSSTQGSGGALAFSGGTLTMTSCEVTGNSGTLGGAILLGTSTTSSLTATISSCTFSGNRSSNAGGVFSILGNTSASITITSSTMTLNAAYSIGGGVFQIQGPSTISITNSTVTKNSASSLAGFMNISSTAGSGFTNVTATGTVFESNFAGTDGGVISVGAKGSLTINSSSFKNNTSVGGGGAINVSTSSTTISTDSSTFDSNQGDNGGAIQLSSTPSVTLTKSTFSNNVATASTGLGGAISASAGTVTINSSTFYRNTAGASGGAINAASTLTLTVNNSTLSSNIANGSASTTGGGAINASGSATSTVASITLNNSTLVYNTATGAAAMGGGIRRGAASIGVTNATSSIIAGNSAFTGPDLSFTGTGTATVGGLGGNLIGVQGTDTPSGKFTVSGTNKTGTIGSPQASGLTPMLANNGGITLTHKALAGSVALNNGVLNGQTADQTGATRAATPTIGAVEGKFVGPYPITLSVATVTTAGSQQHDIIVTYDSENPIDTTTFTTGDIVVTGPRGIKTYTPTFDSSTAGLGNKISVTYKLSGPGSSWDIADNGTYTVTLVADQVVDNAANKSVTTLMGNFDVRVNGTLTVDEASDDFDGDTTPGKLSLREAVAAANYATSTSTINFSLPSSTTINLFGELAITNPTVINGSSITLSGSDVGRIFNFLIPGSGSASTISLLTLTRGRGGDGGAIHGNDDGLTLSQVTITANTGANGGGVATSGLLTINDSTITLNSASISGGGVVGIAPTASISINRSAISSNTAATNGGGIEIGASTLGSATLSLKASTVNNNVVTSTTTTNGGGGINFGGTGTITITNSTLSGNSVNGGIGGGIRGSTSGTINVFNSTIYNNTAAGSATNTGGGGIGTAGTATNTFTDVNLYSTILAGNVHVNHPDLFTNAATISVGTTFEIENSIIGAVTDTTVFNPNYVGSQTGTLGSPIDPVLAPLNNYGGPTQTHGLLPGSPAIDKGSDTPASESFDQRGTGFPRVVNSGVNQADVGAFEGVLKVPLVTDFKSTDIAASTGTFTVTVVFTDNETGVKVSSIGTSDVKVTGGTYVGVVNPISFTATPNSGTPTSVTVTYTFNGPPGDGTFDAPDNGTYTISVIGGEVFDSDTPTNNSTPSGKIGTFKSIIPTTYVVDNVVTDTDDGVYTTGNLTLREAINLSNAISKGVADIITFNLPANTTITLGSSLPISDPFVIKGNTAVGLVISGNDSVRIFDVTSTLTGTVESSISNVTLTHGKAVTGGIISLAAHTLNLNNVTVSFGNATSGVGGGINLTTGTLRVTDSEISNNTASTSGGGIATTTGKVEITRSTISGNRATTGDGGGVNASSTATITVLSSTLDHNFSGATNTIGGGGGIGASTTSTVTITNSTLAYNSAYNVGGAIRTQGQAKVAIDNSTIVRNVITGSGDGGGFGSTATTSGTQPIVTITSSIIAENQGNNHPDLYSAATSVALTVDVNFSLVGLDSGLVLINGSDNTIGTFAPLDAGLGLLKNFGGGTKTLPILAGSPAINKGSNTLGLGTDQRGSARVVSGTPDMGAFEGVLATPEIAKVTMPNVTSDTPTYKVTIVYVDPTGIKVSSIGTSDIKIFGGGYATIGVNPTSFSASPSSGTPTSVSVTYTFNGPPVDNDFDVADNGTYTITMSSGEVFDTDSNPMIADTIGTFNVGIGTVIVVDNAGDSDDSIFTAGNLTLREAIRLANQPFGTTDTITFALPANTTITLGSEFAVTEPVNIQGNSTIPLTIKGSSTSRIFNFNITGKGDESQISNVTLTNGHVTTGTGGAILLNDDALTLTNVVITANSSFSHGGAISMTNGILKVVNSTISNNTGDNTLGSGSAFGGAIYVNTTLATPVVEITNSTISGNLVRTSGGGIYMTGGTLTVTDSTITNNTAKSDTVFMGTVTNGGGGIWVTTATVTINNSKLNSNTALGAGLGAGGALRVASSGNISITNSTFDGNTAGSSGGAITQAGAFGLKAGTLVVQSSTLSNNVVLNTSASGFGGGGAINFGSTSNSSSTITIKNSTISGNAVFGASTTTADLINGGGLRFAEGTINIYNSTITDNTVSAFAATTNGGGGIAFTLTAVNINIESTIIAGNVHSVDPDIMSTPASTIAINGNDNLFGALTDPTLFFNGTYQSGTLSKPLDPLLGPLANNGGPTATHAIVSINSPAIDAGNNMQGEVYDQRGNPHNRSNDGYTDVGAYQTIPSSIPYARAKATNVTSSGGTTFDVTVTFRDAEGIDTTTIDINDVQVTRAFGGQTYKASSFSVFSNFGNTAVTVFFTYDAPGNLWDAADTDRYTVNLMGTVSDADTPTINTISKGSLTTFDAYLGAVTLTVDKLGDVDDGNLKAGELTLREAVNFANANVNSVDTINFNLPNGSTITLGGYELKLTESATIAGPGSGKLTVSGNNASRIFNLNDGFNGVAASFSISGLKLTGGKATGDGGAIYDQDEHLTLTDMFITGNSASGASADGGGLNVEGGGAVISISSSTFSFNSAGASSDADGGAMDFESQVTVTIDGTLIDSNTAFDDGGGLLFQNGVTSGRSVTITNTAIVNNRQTAATGGYGGGISFSGQFDTLVIRNSTISGNTTNEQGGGIQFYNVDTTTLIQNTTIANNVAAKNGGGLNQYHGNDTVPTQNSEGTITLESTIVSNNSGTPGADIWSKDGTVTVDRSALGSYSIVNFADLNPGFSLFGQDLKLQPLDYSAGGPTPVIPLGKGSPAVNAGFNPASLAFDQRGTGFNRKSGSEVDMGAYERQAPTITSVVFGDGTSQRSMVTQMVVNFSESVNFTGDVTAAFTLARDASSTQPGGLGNVTLTANPATGPATSVTITFSGALSQNGSLIDGFYNLSIDASQVSGDGGKLNGGAGEGTNFTVNGNTANKFFRLFGDGDGNGITNLTDFAAFRAVFNLGANAAFDYGEGDNNVGLFDFAQFRARFNLTP